MASEALRIYYEGILHDAAAYLANGQKLEALEGYRQARVAFWVSGAAERWPFFVQGESLRTQDAGGSVGQVVAACRAEWCDLAIFPALAPGDREWIRVADVGAALTEKDEVELFQAAIEAGEYE